MKVLVNLPSLPGIIPEIDLKRYYTQKEILAHTLGYVGVISPKDLKEFSNLYFDMKESYVFQKQVFMVLFNHIFSYLVACLEEVHVHFYI